MNSRFPKRTNRLNAWALVFFLFFSTSCKKEVIEVNVDAYAQLAAHVDFTSGVYKLQFSLGDYPYKEVGVRLSSVKSIFQQTDGLNKQIAVEVAANRYAVFYDTLVKETTYYYQIYVIDPASAKTVYSDVYSFATN
jgi:5-hydroxyisourate hydrolase-like protein (transthyretin family)